MEWLTDYVLPHWPFVAMCLVFGAVGQVMNKIVAPKATAEKHGVRWWIRKTLTLQPVLAGALLGLVWRDPETAVVGLAPSIAYFAASGVCSTWVYNVLKGLAKKKGIAVPGDSTPPEPTPAA